MTRKSFFLSAASLAMVASLSACGSRNAGENLVQVQMSEASYQNLYGAQARGCDDVAGEGCNPVAY
ncbi:hypothetical protein [Lentibacter sp. XHP0401]|jgi:hypothetical protein|uniref:hypothetical protein n=1 Tax=Lentibacter sp. XHP0401 TaxID=2984334 RepID=UPI0021E76EAA|nr:hypothetical protein [Lentibacter sp. XHP0401]MCV2894426.1 hypothetical protein [Lentibacter sp. XHP0401]